MKRTLFTAALALFLALAAVAVHADERVTVILKDGSVVKGSLLGSDASSLTVQDASGSAQDIERVQIRRIFDSSGKPLVLDSANSAQVEDEPSTTPSTEEPMRPTRSHRRAARSHHGRKVAGEVLTWSGLGAFAAGLGVFIYGETQESDATSTYYNSTGYTSSGDYAYDTIPGKPGYYTASQYDQYYVGMTWAVTGCVIGLVGAGCMIAGVCILPHDRTEAEDAALMHYEGGQLSLGMPPISVSSANGPRATLFTARF
jgi:small nuclear ribonucleoprotein (snRNP)-like protein